VLRSEKKIFVSELEEIYKNSSSIVFTHYHGLKVSQIMNLRKSLRESGASFKIIKNTLSRIAADNVKLGHCDSEIFSGPMAIAYSKDPIAAIKGVVEFAKSNDNLKVISGLVNNKSLNITEVQLLAKLPSIEQLRSNIVGILQSPAINLARVLQASTTSLVRVVRVYAEKNK